MTETDVTFLLQQILEMNEFDYILLDLSREMNQLNLNLMAMSQKIIGTYTTDAIGQRKQSCFQHDPYIVKLDLLEHMEFINAKVTQQIESEGDIVQFPYLQVEQTTADLFHCFFDNGSFKKSCIALQGRL